jgi:protein gp37
MAKNSQIQWTDHSWNIAVGCTKVDEDCKFCYMYRGSLNSKRYDPKVVRKTKTVFRLPLTIKEPSRIFVSSLTDVFHPECDSFRDAMWDIIRRCPQHTFQILTKRPERIKDHLPADWGDGWENVWLGTSVGSNAGLSRVNSLINLTTKKWRCLFFLSMEPLYEMPAVPLLESLKYFDWVIVGGESGNENGKYRYRPCEFEWMESILDACLDFGIPVFVKQMGTYLAKRHGLGDRHGSMIEHWPPTLQVREFPQAHQLSKGFEEKEVSHDTC